MKIDPRFKLSTALVLFSLAMSAGCSSGGGDGGSPPLVPPPPPVSPPPPPPPPPPPTGVSKIYVATNGDNTNNTGAENSPYASIQFAVDQAGVNTVIFIAAGVYNELVLIEGTEDSGDTSGPVVLDGSAGAIIDGANLSPSNGLGLITIRDASYISVHGLELRNFKTPIGFSHDGFPAGISVTGSGTTIELSALKIHNIEERSTCTQNDNNCDSGANGIGIYGSTPAGLTNIRLLNNEVYDNILGSSEAITINGNVDGFLLSGNYVHDNNNIGFDFIGLEDDICLSCTHAQNRARNGMVRDNKAENNSMAHFVPNPWYGGDDGNAAGFYVDGAHHIMFEQNISTGNDLGMEVASEAPNGSSDDVIISSNLIYNNFDIGIALGGFDPSPNNEGGGSANRIYIVNNTIYHNKGHSSDLTLNYRIHDLTFVNNIVFGETSIDETYEQAENNIQSSGLNFDNNLWWASQSALAGDVPVSDTNALVAGPNFIDIENGDARLNAGSAAIGAGIIIPDIAGWDTGFWSEFFSGGIILVHGSVDITGTARNINQIDIGASEQ